MYLELIQSNTDENGFDSDSERGFRCLNIPLENKGVQTEAIHYNIELMKWRLFPSLDVEDTFQLFSRISHLQICVSY